jgi:hypothetical protein
VEKYGTARQATDDNTIWRMHFECWITKARIQTQSQPFNTHFLSTATIVKRKRFSVTLNVHFLCCWKQFLFRRSMNYLALADFV